MRLAHIIAELSLANFGALHIIPSEPTQRFRFAIILAIASLTASSSASETITKPLTPGCSHHELHQLKPRPEYFGGSFYCLLGTHFTMAMT